MKKLASLLLVCTLILVMLAGCGQGTAQPSGNNPPDSPSPSEPVTPTEPVGPVEPDTVEGKLLAAASMTNEELLEKAKEEMGTMTVYSTTSLCETAVNNFLEKYPDLSVAYSSVGEADMFTKLSVEVGAAAEGADMVLLQNAYRMENELISEGLLLNYFPDMYKDVVPAEYQDPCVFCFCQKLFVYNNTGGDIGLNNVWQLTEEAYKDKIFFKNPSEEPVGMNFLVMLTSEAQTKELEAAYESYYGKAWSGESGFESASYEWLDKFLANCNYTYAADGGIAEGVSTGAPGNVGLFVFSKLRSSAVTRENLTLSPYAANDGAGMDSFSGFMYATYAQICADTDMPYTSCLFINYLLSEEGFRPWNNEGVMGTYSANTSIALVPDETGLDSEITYWLDCVVVEDGAVVAELYPKAYEFISTRIS